MMNIKTITAAGLGLLLTFGTAWRAPAQDYAKEIKEISKGTRSKFELVETENIVWAVGVGAAKARPVTQAVEKAWGIWKKISGVERWSEMWGPKKALFVLCKNRLQYRNFLKWYAKKYKDSPYLWPGFAKMASGVTYWPQPMPRCFAAMHLKPVDLEGVRNTAVHLLGHLCMIRYKYNNRPIPPWLEEGFGCYLEARTLGKNNCYCFSGGYGDRAARLDKLTNIKWAKWKSVVQGNVRKKSDKNLEQILPLRMSELSADEMGKAWSVIDYMVTKDPAKFVKFVSSMKSFWPSTYDPAFSPAKKSAQERALKLVYGHGLTGLDEAWRAWAKKGFK